MTYQLTWIADVLRSADLNVIEEPVWKEHGHGDVSHMALVIFHHTAGPRHGNYPSEHTLIYGRPDLDGPLCNTGLARDGTWYPTAAGRAYHAGQGSWKGMTAGNSIALGIEPEHTGWDPGSPMFEEWPQVQLQSAFRGIAALLDYMKLPASHLIGHKEWAPHRKNDPNPMNMDYMRNQVSSLMKKPNGSFVGHLTRIRARFVIPGYHDQFDGCNDK